MIQNKKHPEYEFTIMYYNEEVMHVKFAEDGTVIIDKYTDEKDKLPFYFIPDRQQMFTYIEGRCSERSRPDQAELLNLIGLDVYNPYEIVKKTHAVTPDDYFWFRYPGENLKWEDVDVFGRF